MKRARVLRLHTLILLAASSLRALAGGGEEYQYNPYHTGLSTATFDPTALHLAYTIPGGYRQPIVSGDQVFVSRVAVGSHWPDTEHASFELGTGRQVWGDVYAAGSTTQGSAVCDGLFVTHDGNSFLRVYDARSGQLLHETRTGSTTYSTIGAPLLVDRPGQGTIDAYLPTAQGFSRFAVDRQSATRVWASTGGANGVPTLGGDSVFVSGRYAARAYRISDGAANPFFTSTSSGADPTTSLFDPARSRFYTIAAPSQFQSDVMTAWDYNSQDQITTRWTVNMGPRSWSSAATGPGGELLWVNVLGQLGVYSPDDGSLLRSSPLALTQGYTPVVQDGYVWVTGDKGATTYVLDWDTLQPVTSFTGGCPGGGYFWGSALLFDQGAILAGPNGLDVYVVPEPASCALLALAAVGVLSRRGGRVRGGGLAAMRRRMP